MKHRRTTPLAKLRGALLLLTLIALFVSQSATAVTMRSITISSATPTPTLTFATPTSASVAVSGTLTNAATSTLSGGSYGAITYSSATTSHATVNSTTGVVTGVAAGTSVITATQAAVTGVNAQATQTYTVTVTAHIIVIGDSYGGGKVAYILASGDTGYVAGEVHGLIAATEDQNGGNTIIWAVTAYQGTSVPGTSTAIGTGSANTDKIIAQHNFTHVDRSTYAAGVARAYQGGNFTDWYLPSKDELEKLYLNKVAVKNFFSVGAYWSSSEDGASIAWGQYFSNGDQNRTSKNTVSRVRAVRAF